MARRRDDRPDSPEYLARKARFERLLTLYGRKPVLDALTNPSVRVVKLHIARDARGETADRIRQLAAASGAEIVETTKQKVSRISKNSRQDQGVAADVDVDGYEPAAEYLADPPERFAFVAVDGVTTPENVGMIIRSVAAAGLDGVLLPKRGASGVNPLVVKASAGTIFRTGVLVCERIEDGLARFAGAGATVCILAGDDGAPDGAARDLFSYRPPERVVYVVGNESKGVSEASRALADVALSIPMAEGVESLNVAVAASLTAYHHRRATETTTG